MTKFRGRRQRHFQDYEESHSKRQRAPRQKEWKESAQQRPQKRTPYVYDEEHNRFYKVPTTITMDSQRELFVSKRRTTTSTTTTIPSLHEFLLQRSIGTVKPAPPWTSLEHRLVGLSIENSIKRPIGTFSFAHTLEPPLRAFWTNQRTLFVLHQKSVTQWDMGKVDRDTEEGGVLLLRSFVNRYTFDSAISAWEMHETSDSVELLTGTFGSGTPGKLYVYRQPHFLFRPTVSIMNLRTGSVNAATAKTDSEAGEIEDVLFSDGRRVMLWDLGRDADGAQRGTAVRRLCSLSSDAISLSYSETLHSVLAGCRNGSFSLVDTRVPRDPYTVTLSSRFPVTHVQFESSSSYRFLVEFVPTSGGAAADALCFYDFRMLTPHAPKQLCSFSGHVPSSDFPRQIAITSPYADAAFSPSAPKCVLAVGGDRVVRWWREGLPTPIYSFDGKTEQKNSAFSQPGQLQQQKNNFAIFYQKNSLWIGRDKKIKRIAF